MNNSDYSIKIELKDNNWIFSAYCGDEKINDESYTVSEEQRISNKMEGNDVCQKMMEVIKNDIEKNINQKN